jgi:hypothetical protein
LNEIHASYQFQPDSLLLIVNNLNSLTPDYEQESLDFFKKDLQIKVRDDHVCFLEHFDYFQPEDRQAKETEIHQKMVELLNRCKPKEHVNLAKNSIIQELQNKSPTSKNYQNKERLNGRKCEVKLR